MGYSIPPGDYSLPPMQINVGAEIGRSIGAGLAKLGDIKRKEKADAKREKATQNAFKNTLVLNATKAQDAFISNLTKEGYIDDAEDGSQLIDQWKLEIKNKGKAAIEARMKMEFDQDLNDEDRAGFAQTVSDFENYSSGSLNQLGAFVTDANASTSEGFVVTGNSKNGEQTVNMMTLANIQGNSSMFGEGNISTRKLQVRNNQNFVTSTVKIPADSQYFTNVNTQGGGLASEQLEKWSQPGGKIKKETIDNKEYYVFESEINLSSYGGPGGIDLVSKEIEVPKSDDVFKQMQFVDESGSFSSNNINQKAVVRIEAVKDDTTGKPTGYVEKVSYNIVDVGAMAADRAYIADINAQYDSVFLDPKTNTALKQQYLLDLAENQGEMKDGKFVGEPALDWNDLLEMDPAEARRQVTNAMVLHQWTGYFPKQFGEKVALTQMKLEEGSALLERAIEQDLKNPLTGKDYKVGDMVYVTRDAQERYEDPDAKEEDEKYGQAAERQFSGYYTELGNFTINNLGQVGANDDLPDSYLTGVVIPGSNNLLRYFKGTSNDGFYVVKKDDINSKVSANPVTNPQSIYSLYPPK